MDTKHSRLEYLRCSKLGACQRCTLSKGGRHKVVFGDGHPEADLMIIGSRPTQSEDILGDTLPGRPGQILNKILKQAGSDREKVYVSHIVKCRPPGDRRASEEELARCLPFLHAQVGIVRPSAILTLGEHAGNVVTGQSTPLAMSVLASRSWSYEFEKTGMHVPVFCIDNPHTLWEMVKPVGGRIASDGKAAYRKAFATVKKAVAMSQPLELDDLF